MEQYIILRNSQWNHYKYAGTCMACCVVQYELSRTRRHKSQNNIQVILYMAVNVLNIFKYSKAGQSLPSYTTRQPANNLF